MSDIRRKSLTFRSNIFSFIPKSKILYYYKKPSSCSSLSSSSVDVVNSFANFSIVEFSNNSFIAISIRDNELYHFSRQKKIQEPTDITDEIMRAAYQLFKENYHWSRPIRSLGIRADDLVMGIVPVQLDLFMNEQRREKQEKLDRAVDEIRRRFGYHSVQRAFMYQDKVLSSLDAQKSHTVHPVGYFNGR